jgi:hypothetical protein
MTKLLATKYKTRDGAERRARFERAMAPGEFRRGDKARLYGYRTLELAGAWRVERFIAPQSAEDAAQARRYAGDTASRDPR